MARVRFEIGGKVVVPAQLKPGLERKVYDSIVDSLSRTFGNLKCPTHREEPLFQVKGPRIDSVQFEVETCCQQLLDIVNNKSGA